MRHRNQGRRLSMDESERTAMFRNMVTSLFLHGQIKTTEARAKELRRFAERVVTYAKKAPKLDGLEGEALRKAKARRVHLLRQARFWVHDDVALNRLFQEYTQVYANRAGGYTRILKAGRRAGDNAPMAVIAMVDRIVTAPAATEAPAAATEAPAEG
jgi:large subunit ribosomal protein L17